MEEFAHRKQLGILASARTVFTGKIVSFQGRNVIQVPVCIMVFVDCPMEAVLDAIAHQVSSSFLYFS